MISEIEIKGIKMTVENIKTKVETCSTSRIVVRKKYGVEIEAIMRTLIGKNVEEFVFDPRELTYIFQLGNSLEVKSSMDIKRLVGTPITITRNNKTTISITMSNSGIRNTMYRLSIPVTKWTEITKILSIAFKSTI